MLLDLLSFITVVLLRHLIILVSEFRFPWGYMFSAW